MSTDEKSNGAAPGNRIHDAGPGAFAQHAADTARAYGAGTQRSGAEAGTRAAQDRNPPQVAQGPYGVGVSETEQARERLYGNTHPVSECGPSWNRHDPAMVEARRDVARVYSEKRAEWNGNVRNVARDLLQYGDELGIHIEAGSCTVSEAHALLVRRADVQLGRMR